MTDGFGTAGLRERVLAAWTASPARFREDANAEEDLALGGYRDRLVVELAQNAADAAARAGAAGRMRFTLYDEPGAGRTLVAANTGAPLTAEGVGSLATLRASAKRDDAGSVGRFGVGFAAVLAVTDEPVVLSRTGGVRFSRQDTAALVGQVAELDAEVRRRDGHVPVLRLPFAAEGEPPEGYDTAVLLPLRDEAAADLVRRLLAEVDDALLLALPDLERIEIEVDGTERVLADAFRRWQVCRADGEFGPGERARLLADRPTEERTRPYWSVLWAVPTIPALPDGPDSPEVPRTVHAPTPTDEPLSLPALLLATFPLDPSRRHVAAGPLTDRLVTEAATAYADLLHDLAGAGADVLPLVPTGLAAGSLDAALREAILAALPGTPILPAAEDGALLRPRDAVVVEGSDSAFDAVLAPVVSGLVAAGRDRAALTALGVRRLELSELVDQLGSVSADRPPAWWREVYAALSGLVLDPLGREALGALPVPLADGRLVRGARGLLLPVGELPADLLTAFGPYGVRVVHPDATDATLERLGAIRTSPAALLSDGAVRAAVEQAEPEDADQVAQAVLALVAAAPAELPADLWWLSDLELRDTEGELVPANALVVPGSEAEAVLDPDEVAPVDPVLLDRFGPAALEAVGVLRTLRVVIAADVPLDALPDELADLDGVEDWAAYAGPAGSSAGEISAVRDLDWVVDWPRALALFGSSPELRDALVAPVRVVGPDDRPAVAPSYAAWWIRHHVRVGDGPLAGRADPEAGPELAALLDPAPEWAATLDPEVRAAAGLVRQVTDLDPAGVSLLLERLAEPDRTVDAAALPALWSQLGVLTVYPDDPPDRIRVLGADGGTRVVGAGGAVVADAPMWLQRTDLGGYVVGSGPVADGLSDLLDLPLAAEVADGRIDHPGRAVPVDPAVRRLVPGVSAQWYEHDELTVDGVPVSWWVSPDGAAHAATGDGLAKALAWAAGGWPRRHLILAALTEPDRAAEFGLDAAFD